MKKLLYVAAIAVLSTSCSVDNLQEDSINSIEQNSKIKEDFSLLCNTLKVLNIKGEERGQIQSYVDNKNGSITLRILTPNWKVSESRLYYGSINNIGTGEDLFSYGEYEFREGYVGTTYFVEYEFSMEEIKSNFVFNAKLSIQNNGRYENVWATTSELNANDDFYIENYLTDCFK